MPSVINSDNGAVSGTAGLKTSGGNDGITVFQQNGVESANISSAGVMTMAANPILTSGTANGVVYLDGSKQATTGNVLTFNGSLLSSTAVSGTVTKGASANVFNQSTAEFTNIPSWVRVIKLLFDNVVPPSGNPAIWVNVGTSSGYLLNSTAYSSYTAYSSTASLVGASNAGYGFELVEMSVSGIMGKIEIHNFSTNSWLFSAMASQRSQSAVLTGSGTITLSGQLDRVRVILSFGLFQLGIIHLIYEG